MEMAGVQGLTEAWCLKIVSHALLTYHAIVFSVLLGWAVSDIIRWESQAFLFMVCYSWNDLGKVTR